MQLVTPNPLLRQNGALSWATTVAGAASIMAATSVDEAIRVRMGNTSCLAPGCATNDLLDRSWGTESFPAGLKDSVPQERSRRSFVAHPGARQEVLPMRTLIASSTLVAAMMLAAPATVVAQDSAPFCLKSGLGVTNCIYQTM